MNNRLAVGLALGTLATVHLAALSAGFLAPYPPLEQNRALPYAPPMRPHFVDAEGRFHLRPFVYPLADRTGAGGSYEEDRRQPYPIRFLVPAADLAGAATTGIRLFGVDEPARIFLLGTDGFGRDQLSRLLHGAQISLFAGLLATVLSLGLGWVLGTLAGFYGRAVDALLMRSAELFLALPWLYLLFAVRAALPLHVAPAQAFLLLVLVIGLVDWARPARLVRGVVLSARERSYVLAARGFGASDFYLIRRHIAPQTFGLLLTQAAILVPQYILAEVTLSFLGLGVSEPAPSWGNMLAALQRYHVLSSYWWMWAPGLALVPMFLAYYALAEALHRRAGPASP
ncbi:MAG TPA: ABC transporter permease [Vicinamibacteria bacterium]|nr:ABC transporter permease [Vicinamibacteria bacterium]